MQIALPSGLAGTIRGLKVKEFGALNDRKAVKSGEAFDRIFKDAFTDATDWGPYEAEKFRWSKALVGDYSVMMIALRRATHGDTFKFDIRCPNAADEDCAPIKWKLDLADLPVKQYPAASLEAFRNGQPLETQFGGRKVQFNLATMEASRAAMKSTRMANDADLLVMSVQTRLVSIEGIDDRKDANEWIGDLPLGELTQLFETFEGHDGGVETTILVKCESCGATPEVELPLDPRQFWLARPKG